MHQRLVYSHYHYDHLDPSPLILLKDVQEWVSRMPESDLCEKINTTDKLLYALVDGEDLFKVKASKMLDSDTPYLESFAQFFVDFYKREDILNIPDSDRNMRFDLYAKEALVALREYLAQH